MSDKFTAFLEASRALRQTEIITAASEEPTETAEADPHCPSSKDIAAYAVLINDVQHEMEASLRDQRLRNSILKLGI